MLDRFSTDVFWLLLFIFLGQILFNTGAHSCVDSLDKNLITPHCFFLPSYI